VGASFSLSAMKGFNSLGDEKGAILYLIVCMLVVIYPLALIIGTVVFQGAPGITLELVTQDVRRLGAEGGILPAITGTFLLMGIMFFIAVPLGICAGIYLQEYAGEHLIVRVIKIAVSVLRGVPSIVFGLFALAFFVPIFGVIYALPMIIRTSTESLRSVPMGLREGSLALGATKWQTIKKIVIPPALPGILTGVVLGIGEAAGETAPIIFLSRLNGDALPSLFDTITALPMHLFSMFQYRGYGDTAQVAQRNLNTWATAFILLLIILTMNIIALILREKYRKEF
jgi:phosphate transport system permease protein